jgi:hypothetical protein
MGVMSGCRRGRRFGSRLGLKGVGLDEMINHKCAEFDKVVADIDDELSLVVCNRLGSGSTWV